MWTSGKNSFAAPALQPNRFATSAGIGLALELCHRRVSRPRLRGRIGCRMSSFKQLGTPAALIDLARMQHNIARMPTVHHWQPAQSLPPINRGMLFKQGSHFSDIREVHRRISGKKRGSSKTFHCCREKNQAILQPVPASATAVAAMPSTLFSPFTTCRRYMSWTGLWNLLIVHLPRGLSITAPSMAA